MTSTPFPPSNLEDKTLTSTTTIGKNIHDNLQFQTKLPGFVPAKMPYQRSSVINDVALSTAPRYTPGPRLGGNG